VARQVHLGVVHLLYLSGFENRLVLLSWTWAMLTRRGGARVIEDPSGSRDRQ
jgi:hypothetical protein